MVNQRRPWSDRLRFTLFAELVGAGLVVFGVGLLSVPIAVIVAGITLIGIGYLLE
jgi:hypothetical protein